MNNRQLYRTTFSKLHTDCELDWEAKAMETKKKLRCSRKLVIVSMILVLIFAMTCIANAATGGQLVDNVRVFINGQEVDSSVYLTDDGSVEIDVKDAEDVRVTGEGSEAQLETKDSSDYSIKMKGDKNSESIELGIKDKSNK